MKKAAATLALAAALTLSAQPVWGMGQHGATGGAATGTTTGTPAAGFNTTATDGATYTPSNLPVPDAAGNTGTMNTNGTGVMNNRANDRIGNDGRYGANRFDATRNGTETNHRGIGNYRTYAAVDRTDWSWLGLLGLVGLAGLFGRNRGRNEA